LFGNHKHKKFIGPFGNIRTIDEMVEVTRDAHNPLVKKVFDLERDITALKSELATIHAHYRSQLCDDCCHADVCGVSPSVKYGYECEDKAHPVEFAINIVDLSEPEPKKEEKQ